MSDSRTVTREDLARLLDPDPQRGADKYTDLFLRLTKFFEWRQCSSPEDLAQDTIARGFKKIAGGAELFTDPIHYFFGIAQNILKEDRRAERRARTVPLDAEGLLSTDDFSETETRIAVEQALARLSDDERELVVRYHSDDRDALCRDLGITREALRVRAHRIQRRLLERICPEKRAAP